MLLPCALLRAGKSRRGYMLFRQAGAAQGGSSRDRRRPTRAEGIRGSSNKFARSRSRSHTSDLTEERTEFRDPLTAGAGRSGLGSWKELWVARNCHWRSGCATAVREPNRRRACFSRHPRHTGSPAWTAKPRDLEAERPHRVVSASPVVSALPDSRRPQENAMKGPAPARPFIAF